MRTGNRQAALPGHRTGAPGVHINKRPGYQLLESRVRVFVAPPIDDILACPVRTLTTQINKKYLSQHGS
jgi:large subunit ribosomal protein L41